MSEVQKRTELAFEYSRDAVKQLMTLATGVVALTVTFSKEYVGDTPSELEWCVVASWILLLISVGCGQWCLMGLTGILGSERQPPPALSVYAMSVKVPAILQVLSFFAGLSLVILFAVSVLRA